jgi:hypothetical protein
MSTGHLDEESSQRVREALGEVLDNTSYQRELPGEGGALTSGSSLDIDLSGVLDVLGPLGVIARVLLLIGVGVLVILALVWFGRWLAQRNRRIAGVDGEEVVAAIQGEASGGVSLSDAQAAAEAGHYREAVHLLLLCALAVLNRRRPLAPARTSREILLDSADETTGPLTRLVEAVEWSWFGDRSADRNTYDRCFRHYQEIAHQAGAYR